MEKRKPLKPMPQRGLLSEFAYVQFPKANERQSIATWSSPGRSADGNAISGGTYRATVIRKQFGTR